MSAHKHLVTEDRTAIRVSAPETAATAWFRIDAFTVPEAARAEFDAAVRRSTAFLRTLPGNQAMTVFVKGDGPTTFDVVTMAVWESREALENAGREARAYYERIGFDPAIAMQRWGVEAAMGNYTIAPDQE